MRDKTDSCKGPTLTRPESISTQNVKKKNEPQGYPQGQRRGATKARAHGYVNNNKQQAGDTRNNKREESAYVGREKNTKGACAPPKKRQKDRKKKRQHVQYK